mmetsp:Transcript_555/g.601  ORF Transcript_555/g.601 Transcript_555/m.601 type:complete len:84 (-) Transcript_555:442-693(-)
MDYPYWIYTNSEGVVVRTDQFNERHVVSKIGNQYAIDELVAVCKMADNREGHLVGNRCILMSTRELAQKMSQTGSHSSEIFAI